MNNRAWFSLQDTGIKGHPFRAISGQSLQASGGHLVQELAVLTDQLCRVGQLRAGGSAVGGIERRQHQVPYPISRIAQIGVRFVLDPSLPLLP